MPHRDPTSQSPLNIFKGTIDQISENLDLDIWIFKDILPSLHKTMSKKRRWNDVLETNKEMGINNEQDLETKVMKKYQSLKKHPPF
jgi:hypothetical protein